MTTADATAGGAAGGFGYAGDVADVVSGTLPPATCTAHGAEMWNHDLDSPATVYPDRARSDLWYRLSWPDGRSGYLSEVYLDAASRGGLGQPACT
ncbi:hypothetical protein [Pseudonocardia halophobica]|uniref:hypothetical protein n=1 Tax=Pseudonocardia halophobica TaxID=29401 RepID=UPI00055ABB9B|nr:hypothetical protein [Pseudonocardia halophobica]